MSVIFTSFKTLKEKIKASDIILVNGALFYILRPENNNQSKLISVGFSDPIDESNNEVVHFNWEAEGNNSNIYLDESGIINGSWVSDDTFVCVDSDGDAVEFQFKANSDLGVINEALNIKAIKVAVACRDANGSPAFYMADVNVNQKQYDLGIHYDIAEQLAQDAGYDTPFLCFDDTEHMAIIEAATTLQAA